MTTKGEVSHVSGRLRLLSHMDAVDFSRGPGTPPDPQRVTPTTASPQCTRGRLRRAGRFLFPFLYAALPAPCTLRAAFDVPFGPQAHSLLEELQVRLPSRQRQPAALAPAAAYATAGASAPFRCIVATTLSTPPSLPRRAASGPAPSRRDSASQDSPSQHGGALRAAPPPEGLFEPHLPQTWPSASPPAHLGRRCEHRVLSRVRCAHSP